MKKQILNLGKSLDKAAQKTISGGLRHYLGNECITASDCQLSSHEIKKCCLGTCIYLNQNATGIIC
jgi:hypothetical protein